jgi:4-amino-4-deoxy-L-arabinose transferase-like glycosyltransferase
MRCAEYRNGMGVEDHARECAACGRWLENQGRIRLGLKTLAGMENRGPSPAVGAALLREWKPAERGRRWKAAAFAGALAAGVACLVLLLRPHGEAVRAVRQEPQPVASVRPVEAVPAAIIRPRRHKRRAVRTQPQIAAAEFIEVPFAAPLSSDERAQLLRVSMPVATLASWGFRVAAGDQDRVVDADVVVGENGLARAVHLVR